MSYAKCWDQKNLTKIPCPVVTSLTYIGYDKILATTKLPLSRQAVVKMSNQHGAATAVPRGSPQSQFGSGDKLLPRTPDLQSFHCQCAVSWGSRTLFAVPVENKATLMEVFKLSPPNLCHHPDHQRSAQRVQEAAECNSPVYFRSQVHFWLHSPTYLRTDCYIQNSGRHVWEILEQLSDWRLLKEYSTT